MCDVFEVRVASTYVEIDLGKRPRKENKRAHRVLC